MGEILSGIDPKIKMHDFRIVTGPTHTNVIFDVVVPFKYRLSDSELKKELSEGIRERCGENCYAVVNIDKAYV